MWLNNFFPFCSNYKLKNDKITLYENNIEFQNNFFSLINLVLDSFKFEGLPDTCNERYFKLCLIWGGCAVLADDKDFGYISLGTAPNPEEMNMYGEPNKVFAFGWNGFNRTYNNYMYGSENSNADAVVCRDNDLMYPMINVIWLYATRLTDCMRSIDVTAKKLKTPYFITCDEAQKTSIKKILDDVDFNKDSIIANRSTSPNEFNVLQTNVNPAILDTLWSHFYNLQSEVRSQLGINSATNISKKERLLSYEAHTNDLITDLNLDIRFKNYQLFCDTVNEHFGLNIKVINNVENKEDDSVEQFGPEYLDDDPAYDSIRNSVSNE